MGCFVDVVGYDLNVTPERVGGIPIKITSLVWARTRCSIRKVNLASLGSPLLSLAPEDEYKVNLFNPMLLIFEPGLLRMKVSYCGQYTIITVNCIILTLNKRRIFFFFSE